MPDNAAPSSSRTETNSGWSGLSCYTAAFHEYLSAEWDANSVLARSIRLAVNDPARPLEGPVPFSHHEPALDRLPDDSVLVYRSDPTVIGALGCIRDQVEQHGRAIVVVDSGRLPWSVARGDVHRPHWVVVDGLQGSRWHVRDPFAAPLPDHGHQLPFTGWVEGDDLATMIESPRPSDSSTALRNDLAMGREISAPLGAPTWLERHRPPRHNSIEPLSHEWVVGTQASLTVLADRFRDDNPRPFLQAEDLWAVAGHHIFALRWQLERERNIPEADDPRRVALDRWITLPRTMRVALESHARGRPRLGLVRESLLRLAEHPEPRYYVDATPDATSPSWPQIRSLQMDSLVSAETRAPRPNSLDLRSRKRP